MYWSLVYTVRLTKNHDVQNNELYTLPFKWLCFFTSDEIEWILDLDKDSRLLIIENNRTYSLCGNNWTNEYATAVCRHLKRSDNGIAGVIPRNTNLSQIPFGQDSCPVNFTNLLECKSDNTNAAREICNFTGDASVTCYSKFPATLLNE